MSSPKGFFYIEFGMEIVWRMLEEPSNHYKLGLEDICLRNQCIER